MSTNKRRLITVAAALGLLTLVASGAHAQCCGTTTTAFYQPTTVFFQPTTAFYQPTTTFVQPTTTFVQPTTTFYSGGWYPGYWADRWRMRRWGVQPTTVVAAQPVTFTAGFAPSTCSSCQTQTNFVAAYAPVSSCSSCSTCASCAPSTCSTCTAGYAPSCPCGSSCGCSTDTVSSCPNCSAGTVVQASYQPSSQPQPSCGCSATTNYSQQSVPVQPQPTQVTPPPAPPAQTTPLAPTPDPRPGLDPNQPNGAAATTTNRPIESAPPQATPQQPQQPEPSNSPRPEYDLKNEVKKPDSSTYNEAPALFSPQDRTAQRSIAPVHHALYLQPTGYNQVSTGRTVVTAEQAQKDAIGWSN